MDLGRLQAGKSCCAVERAFCISRVPPASWAHRRRRSGTRRHGKPLAMRSVAGRGMRSELREVVVDRNDDRRGRRVGSVVTRRGLLWLAPRLDGELLKLGIDLSRSTVAKRRVKPRRAALADLAEFPLQQCRRYCRDRSLRRSNSRFQVAVRTGHPRSRPTTHLVYQPGLPPDRRENRSADHRSASAWETVQESLIRDRDESCGHV